MSHYKTISTAQKTGDAPYTEQNISDPIMDDRQSRPVVTIGSGVTKRRAAQVGLRGNRRDKYTPQERLEARIISKGEGCWETSGHRLHNGSTQFHYHGSQMPTHRVAWELTYGPIPDGYVIAHTCDNPPCVRLDHLVLTTQTENVHDSIRKGRYRTFGVQKLDQHQVLAIREASANGEAQGVIARRFGIARNTVSGIVNHRSWAHLTKPVDGPQPANIPNVEPVRYVHLEIRGEVAS